MVNKLKKTDMGTLRINNDVIASIAKNAALQVDGVVGVRTNTWTTISDFLRKGYHHKGVTLDISENDVKIDISIIVKFGVMIPEAANLAQENIRTSIEEMTGLTVSEVNINIADIQSE